MAYRDLFLTLGLVLAGCGGDDVSCGSGTTLVGGMCVGSAGPTCGMGTTLVDGMCVGSAGPTCGTGTTLSNGMCVGDSSCGPGTVLQNGDCVVDTSAPAPVTALAATSTSTSVGLSWTAGTSSTETLVARLVAGAYDTPAGATTYTAGQTLPGGATVIAAGASTTATDTITTPGRYSYLVWSRNASGNYGFPREVSAIVAVPAQTGTVVVDVNAGTATVSAQPANVALAAANVVFDSGTGTVSFDLSATQNTAGHLFNVKAVFGTPSVGTVSNATGATATNDPFITMGIGAIPPATMLTQSVAVTTVASTDVVTLPITIKESGLAIVGSNAVDMDGGSSFSMQLPQLRGRGNNNSVFMDGQFDASGRYFYGLTRWSPALFRLDTATGDVTATMPYPIAAGSGSFVKIAADGYAYVVIAMSAHHRGNATGIILAKLDPVTMTTVATTTLVPSSTAPIHAGALHGTTLAIGYGRDVYLADIGTMTFTDTDPTSADVVDPVNVTTSDAIQRLMFSPDGTALYASERKSTAIYSVDPAAFTSATYHTASNDVFGLTIDSAGVLWWGQSDGLFSFDGTTETQVPNFTGAVDAIGPRNGNTVAVAARTGSTAVWVDVTDGTTTSQGSVNSDRLGHSYIAFPTP